MTVRTRKANPVHAYIDPDTGGPVYVDHKLQLGDNLPTPRQIQPALHDLITRTRADSNPK